MRRTLLRLLRSERAAIAPTAALVMFALIAVGGVGFDYARLAAMDTELQQAADQAALAAATQLDRLEDSQTRAQTAISDPDDTHRLAANLSRFANDGGGSSVEIADIIFCSDFDDSEPDTTAACTVADDGPDSRFVVVTTEVRTANFALTPVVQAFSGTVSATAVAGVESSICNVAPLLVCGPTTDWPTSDDIGKGLRLKPFDSHTPWAPGNYGLLDFGNGNPAVLDALMGFGLNGCQDTLDTQTEPGVKEVTDAINTRLDVYDNTTSGKCDTTTGYGCPAENAQKDMVRTETYVVDTARTVTIPPAAPACGQSGSGFPGVLTLGTSFTQSPAAKSLQRDDCHYSDSCTDVNIGDGDWDFDGYMTANHPGVTAEDVGGTTRYAVYQWEIAHDMLVRQVSATQGFQDRKIRGQDRRVWTFTKQCAYRNPIFASTAYPAQKDRRVLTILAADCTNLHGTGQAYEDFTITRAFDVFVTEPSLNRASPTATDNKEIYGEILGPATPFEAGNGFQYYSRAKPYLVR